MNISAKEVVGWHGIRKSKNATRWYAQHPGVFDHVCLTGEAISGSMDKAAPIILRVTSKLACLRDTEITKEQKNAILTSTGRTPSEIISSAISHSQTVQLPGRSAGGKTSSASF